MLVEHGFEELAGVAFRALCYDFRRTGNQDLAAAVAAPLWAQTLAPIDDAEKTRLENQVKTMKAQAEEIAALRARLDRIEGSQVAAPAARVRGLKYDFVPPDGWLNPYR